jgi:hypothetical protein
MPVIASCLIEPNSILSQLQPPNAPTTHNTTACGEAVDLALASTLPVALDPRLLAGAHTHLVGPYRLAWLDGRLAPPRSEEAERRRREEAAKDPEERDLEMLEADDDAPPPPGQQQHQQQAAADGDAQGEQQQQQGGQVAPAQHEPLQLAPGGVDAAALEAAMARGGPEAAAAVLAAAAAGGDNGGIFIGDVRLSEVKQALARAGIPSAFRAGKLLCAGAVVVSRGAGADEGVLEIEGPLSDDYYRMWVPLLLGVWTLGGWVGLEGWGCRGLLRRVGSSRRKVPTHPAQSLILPVPLSTLAAQTRCGLWPGGPLFLGGGGRRMRCNAGV